MEKRLKIKPKAGLVGHALTLVGDVLIPLVFAFIVGSIFSVICGTSPFTLYGYIIQRAFMSTGGLLNTLGYATPIIITGMATALSLRVRSFWAD